MKLKRRISRMRVTRPILSVCVLAFLAFSLGSTTSRAEPPPPQRRVDFSLPADRSPAPWGGEAPIQDLPQVETQTLIAGAAPPPNGRFGAATNANSTQATWLAPLGAGWYLNFTARPPSSLTAAEFVQVIRLRQNKVNCDYVEGYTTSPSLTKTGVGSVIASNRGALWIIGNEPDRGPNPDQCWLRGQDDTMPEVYAQIYHDAYAFIKANDPTARVANAGLVEVTPNRLQYLERVWQAYLNRYGTPMPVDVWNIHLYILPETTPDGLPNGTANIALGTDPALGKRDSGGDPAKCADPNVYCYAEADDMGVFAEQVVAMRTWMKQHGQQNKALILTEYSILYPYEIDPGPPQNCFLQDEYGQCFTPDRIRSFMTRSFDYLDSASDPALGYPADGNRLVQRWLWFGVNFQGAGSVSNLVTDSQTALTPLGELFQSSVASRPTYVNLRPDPVPPLSAYAPSGVATASLAVSVYNIGTAPTASSFTVTFYSDGALTKPFGSAVIPPGLPGLEERRAIATVSWPGLLVGSHPFWARVDSGEAVAESDEKDNVAAGVVTVLSKRLYLPIASRS